MLQVQVPGEVHCQSRNGLKNGMRCGHSGIVWYIHMYIALVTLWYFW